MWNRLRALWDPPVTDDETKNVVATITAREKAEARRLRHEHREWRQQNHFAERLAQAYRSEPR